MNLRKILVSGLAAFAVAAGAVGVSMTSASASIPTPVEGNVTILSAAPRIVASPGTVLQSGVTKTFKVAGETFGGTTIPANATGVTLSVSSTNPAAGGKVTVWTTEAGRPGTGQLNWDKGVQATTNLVAVGLNSEGKFNVESSTKTNVVMAILNYVTPHTNPVVPAPVEKSIAKTDRAAIKVGGSIRTRGTEVGSVVLTEGKWDARAAASWRGLNSTNNTVPAGVNLSGTFALVKGDGTPADDTTIIAPDFSNNITGSAPSIPRVSSATLTVDPIAPISAFITVPAGETLKVTAVLFAAASDSSQAGSDELQAGLDFASFLKVA
jgi:hypothetical protein